jgi:hypothetical protein
MAAHSDARASTTGGGPRWERLLLAGALAAGALVVLAVGAGAIVARQAGAMPGTSAPLVAVAALAAGLALVLWGRLGGGPVASLARRLPVVLDGARRRQPVVTGLAALLVIVALVQIGRISCFMADPNLRWASAYPLNEFGTRHMCIPAYVQAAELSRRSVTNVYAEEHYPAHSELEKAKPPAPTSTVENLLPFIRDAFEYPPPFLLLPRAALALTNDFLVIRTGWFLLQLALFVAVALAVARHVGGSRGRLAAFLLAALLSSFPVLFTFQFGQFHLAAITLAVSGMLAVSSGRDRVGGALLAVALVTKVFPGLLLLYLAIRRRGRPVLWTLIFSGIYAIVGLLVLGPAPYRAFFEYHLPRVFSGEAFAFFLNSDLTIAANASVYAIAFKLERLGVPGATGALAQPLVWIYTVLLLGATALAARRRREAALEPAVWLALLTLGSLRSPDAPNVYIGASALWLLTLVAVEARGRPRRVALFVAAWVIINVIPPPPDPKATIALWLTCPAAMLAVGFWIALRRRTRDEEARPHVENSR